MSVALKYENTLTLVVVPVLVPSVNCCRVRSNWSNIRNKVLSVKQMHRKVKSIKNLSIECILVQHIKAFRLWIQDGLKWKTLFIGARRVRHLETKIHNAFTLVLMDSKVTTPTAYTRTI